MKNARDLYKEAVEAPEEGRQALALLLLREISRTLWVLVGVLALFGGALCVEVGRLDRESPASTGASSQ